MNIKVFKFTFKNILYKFFKFTFQFIIYFTIIFSKSQSEKFFWTFIFVLFYFPEILLEIFFYEKMRSDHNGLKNKIRKIICYCKFLKYFHIF